jgi:hypothetical protein
MRSDLKTLQAHVDVFKTAEIPITPAVSQGITPQYTPVGEVAALPRRTVEW